MRREGRERRDKKVTSKQKREEITKIRQTKGEQLGKWQANTKKEQGNEKGLRGHEGRRKEGKEI